MPRRPVEWMNRADDYILEFLDDIGVWANPATIAFNLDYSNGYISDRCNELVRNDLLEKSEEKAMYRITEKGHRYLNREIGPEQLE